MTEEQTVQRDHALGLYLHIPFCVRKCDYCDFYSLPGGEDKMDAYCEALCRHLERSAPLAADRWVDSVYIGGGTPSHFGGSRLGQVCSVMRNHYRLTGDCEITVECNPDSVSEALLNALAGAGVNRISLGAQSAQDEELARIHRLHSWDQVCRAVSLVRAAGFSNLSLDLIYGLPGQTMDSWRRSLEQVLALEPEHLSCYGLKLEEGTPLWERRDREELADDDTQADLYRWCVETLAQAGLEQYEISNFARPGRASRHNLRYWLGQEYLGFGPGAYSYFSGCRYGCPRDLEGYLGGVARGTVPVCDVSQLSREDLAQEYLMLRLRTSFGVETGEYQKLFGEDFSALETRFQLFARQGWAQKVKGRWRFTPTGFLLSNSLIVDLLETREAEMV